MVQFQHQIMYFYNKFENFGINKEIFPQFNR